MPFALPRGLPGSQAGQRPAAGLLWGWDKPYPYWSCPNYYIIILAEHLSLWLIWYSTHRLHADSSPMIGPWMSFLIPAPPCWNMMGQSFVSTDVIAVDVSVSNRDRVRNCKGQMLTLLSVSNAPQLADLRSCDLGFIYGSPYVMNLLYSLSNDCPISTQPYSIRAVLHCCSTSLIRQWNSWESEKIPHV